MTFYTAFLYAFIIGIYICAFYNKSELANKFFYYLFLLIYFLLVTFRPLEFSDTYNYADVFNRMQRDYHFTSASSGIFGKDLYWAIEIGYFELIKFVKFYLVNNYRVFFGIVTFLAILLNQFYLRYYQYKSYRNDILYFYFMLPYLGYAYSMIYMRTFLALSLCLAAFYLIEDKGKKPQCLVGGFLLYLVAFLIHRTIIIFIIVEIIYHFSPALKRTIYRVLWIISGVLLLFRNAGSYDRIQNSITKVLRYFSFLSYDHYYQGQTAFASAISIRAIFFWLIGGLILLNFDNIINNRVQKQLLVYYVGLIVMCVMSYTRGGSRVYDFFLWSLPPILTEIYTNGTASRMKAVVLLGVAISYGLLGTTIVINMI